jgi:hypothetical protein
LNFEYEYFRRLGLERDSLQEVIIGRSSGSGTEKHWVGRNGFIRTPLQPREQPSGKIIYPTLKNSFSAAKASEAWDQVRLKVPVGLRPSQVVKIME